MQRKPLYCPSKYFATETVSSYDAEFLKLYLSGSFIAGSKETVACIVRSTVISMPSALAISFVGLKYPSGTSPSIFSVISCFTASSGASSLISRDAASSPSRPAISSSNSLIFPKSAPETIKSLSYDSRFLNTGKVDGCLSSFHGLLLVSSEIS